MKTVKRQIIYVLILIISSANIGMVYTGNVIIDGTIFADTLYTNNIRLHLKGAALLRYLIFIEAYAGAFYLPRDKSGSQALDDIPKYLVLEYRVNISAPDFAKATSQKIKESVSNDVFQQLQPKIQRLNQLYRDVKSGDRYSLGYIPGKGTQLFYNTTLLGTIEGYDFSRAVFSIWIGDKPIDTAFRNKLLGGT